MPSDMSRILDIPEKSTEAKPISMPTDKSEEKS